MGDADAAQLMANVLKMHENDPNFPHTILVKIKEFLGMSRTQAQHGGQQGNSVSRERKRLRGSRKA